MRPTGAEARGRGGLLLSCAAIVALVSLAGVSAVASKRKYRLRDNARVASEVTPARKTSDVFSSPDALKSIKLHRADAPYGEAAVDSWSFFPSLGIRQKPRSVAGANVLSASDLSDTATTIQTDLDAPPHLLFLSPKTPAPADRSAARASAHADSRGGIQWNDETFPLSLISSQRTAATAVLQELAHEKLSPGSVPPAPPTAAGSLSMSVSAPSPAGGLPPTSDSGRNGTSDGPPSSAAQAAAVPAANTAAPASPVTGTTVPQPGVSAGLSTAVAAGDQAAAPANSTGAASAPLVTTAAGPSATAAGNSPTASAIPAGPSPPTAAAGTPVAGVATPAVAGGAGTTTPVAGAAPGVGGAAGTTTPVAGAAPGVAVAAGTSTPVAGAAPGSTGAAGITVPAAGAVPGVAGAAPGVAGAAPGVAGAAPGVAGAVPGVAGAGPGVAGAGPGVAATVPGVAATVPGVAGVAPLPGQPGFSPVVLPGAVPLVEQTGGNTEEGVTLERETGGPVIAERKQLSPTLQREVLRTQARRRTPGEACFDACDCWPVWSIGIVMLVINLVACFIAFYLTASLYSKALFSSHLYKGGGYWMIGVGLGGLATGGLIGGFVPPSCWAGALYLGGSMMSACVAIVLIGRRGAWLGAIGGVGCGGVIGYFTRAGVSGIIVGIFVGLLFGIVVGFAPFCRGLKINERYIRAGIRPNSRYSEDGRDSKHYNDSLAPPPPSQRGPRMSVGRRTVQSQASTISHSRYAEDNASETDGRRPTRREVFDNGRASGALDS